MTETIMPAFQRFPEEGNIIGRLLAGYGELELELCFCVGAIRNDFDLAFKPMFRPRGETQRIQIADAIGREMYRQFKLGTQFEEAISAITYCLKIRNQYAHCHWTDNFGKELGFVQLEAPAKGHKPVGNVFQIKIQNLDLGLLQEQESYFVYTRHCLRFLYSEIMSRAGKYTKNPFPSPKKVKRPTLCRP